MVTRRLNRALVIVSILALGATSLLVFPLSGDWMDRMLSDWCSRRFGVTVEIRGASIRGLQTVSFAAMNVRLPFSEDPVTSGAGRIRLWPAGISLLWQRPDRVGLSLTKVDASRTLLTGAPVIGKALAEAFDEGVTIDRLDSTWIRRDGRWTVHVSRLESEAFRLHGGFRLEGSSPVKAHWVVLLPAPRIDALPRQLRASVYRFADGWGGLRLQYVSGLFRAIGRRGVFFEAAWQEADAQRND